MVFEEIDFVSADTLGGEGTELIDPDAERETEKQRKERTMKQVSAAHICAGVF